MREVEVVRIPVSPANASVLQTAITQRRSDYFSSPRCLALEVGCNDDRTEVIAVVTWASKDAHAAARGDPAAAVLFAAVGKFAAGPPSLTSIDSATAGTAKLAGQIVLVTGGASGIGRAIVDRFMAEGAHIGVADRNARGLALVQEAHGDRVVTIEADLRTAHGNIQAVERTVAAFGKLDCLVANAGMFDGFRDFSTLDIASIERGFDAIFDINVRGLILGCRAALPHLAASRGALVVTLSNASFHPDGGGVMYVASKHAALGVVRQLAHELAPHVRVNAVAPGATRTAIAVPAIFGDSVDQRTPEVSAAIKALVPLGAHSEAADHTGAYVLLAARDEASAMTGTVIVSDGGLGVRGLRRIRGGEGLLETLGLRQD